MRGPLFLDTYRPQLSGHETFTLRYGWLKKAFDAVVSAESATDNKSIFLGEDAIARFGVGKNMVASMRHWSYVAGVLSESQNLRVIEPTELGKQLFGANGLDPYMEHPATLWLIHWHLASRPQKTTWFWAFNNFPALTFNREHLVQGVCRLAKDRGWQRVSESTVKTDVACFIRTYVAMKTDQAGGQRWRARIPLN